MDGHTYSLDEQVEVMRRQSLENHSTSLSKSSCDRKSAVMKPEQSSNPKSGLSLLKNLSYHTVTSTKVTLSAAASWLGDVGNKFLSNKGDDEILKHNSELHTVRGNTVIKKDPDDLDSIMDASDACAALRRAVEVKREPQAIAAMDVMSRLAESNGSETISELGAGGACTYIDQLLSWRNTSSAICESGLRAICSLVAEEKVRLKFVSGGACYRIVKATQMQMHDEIVLEWGLRVIRYLAFDECSLQKMTASGVCEVVALALNTYNQNDNIVEWSCRIIYALTQDDVSQDKFAAAETCEGIIVSVVQERISKELSMNVAIWSLRAIGGLARRHARNKDRLANLGACELTQQLVQKFSFEDASFAESLCWAVGNLAFPDEANQERLAAAGACHTVVQALDYHITSPEMVQEGFRAIRNLGHLHENNLFILAREEACEVVMRAIKLHTQSSSGSGTLQWGWFVVASLSDNLQNLKRFGAAGACGELVKTISTFGGSSDVAQWTCLALSKLADDADICKFIGCEGGCRGVVQILTMHTGIPDVVEECFSAIASLCSHEDGKNRELLGESGISDIFVSAMCKHEREEAVGEQACWALSRLLSDTSRPSGQSLVAKLVAAGLCKILPKILSRHPLNDKVAEYGCQALALLSCFGNPSYLTKLGSAGAPAAIIVSLQNHTSNASISRWALQAITNLCSDEGNLSKFRVASAPAAVSRVLQSHHTRSEELSRFALLALASLAADDGCRTKIASLDGCAEAIIACLYVHSDSEVLAICACDIITQICQSDPHPIPVSNVGTFSPSNANQAGASSSLSGSSFIVFSDGTLSISPAERLNSIGISMAMSMILSKHSANVVVICAACKAIEALCTGEGGESNRGKLAQAGVCPLLMQVLRTLELEGSPQSTVSTSSICLAISGLLREGGDQFENQNIFATLDAQEEMKAILDRYADNSTVIQSCCKAVSLLASGNQLNQGKLLDCGATSSIVSLFKRYIDNDVVIVQLGLAVAELSFDNPKNSSAFGRMGICKDLVSVLMRHRKNETVCEACCRAIFSLKEQNILLGAAGACEAVLPILAQHPGSEAVAQWVCRAIGSLAEDQNNKKILGASSACEVITAALQRHVANESLLSVVLMRNTSSAGVAQWGCAAMYFLARGRGKLEEEYRRKLVAAGACEAVAKALVKYSEVETVAQTCCRAVVVLAEGKDREAHAARLGSLGVCSTIVDSLHLFPSSIPVAKWGCRAVAVLADSCEANVVRLVAAGCCEVVPVAMQAHQSSEAVAGAGCDALTSLAANVKSGYAARLGHTGACESVVSVLRRHLGNADVVERGCRAMANLALVKGNSSWFGPAGACDALLKVQQRHPNNAALAAAAWLAAGSLCVDNNNRHRLGQAGACEQVVDSMRVLLQFSAVAKSAGTAIGKLCEINHLALRSVQDLPEIGFSSPTNTADASHATSDTNVQDNAVSGTRENRERLFKAGCCNVIVDALECHVGDIKDGLGDMGVALSLCRTIGILAKGVHSHQEREQFYQVGACSAVVRAMQRFPNNEGVARCGCLAIRALAFDHNKNQEAIRISGGCEVVVNALQKHSLTQIAPLVHEAAAWAVSNLAQECAENKELLGSLGAVEAVVDAFDFHGRYLEVARWCCSALRHLCDGNEINRSKISFSNAAELLCAAIQKYSTEDELVECALLTMIVVCADRVGQHRLGVVGVCKVVVQLFPRSDIITSFACELITALSFKSVENQTKLGQAGACKAVLQTLECVMMRSELTSTSIIRKTHNYTVLDTMKDIASAVFVSQPLTDSNEKVTTLVQRAEGISPVEGTLKPSAVILIEDCLAGLHGLAIGHEGNRNKLISVGALDLISAVLNTQCLSEQVKERARLALEAIENITRSWS